MSKKSYMSKSNIVNEGKLETFLRAILPKHTQDAIKQSRLKKIEPKVKKLTGKLEKSIDNSNKIASDFERAWEKEFGEKVNIRRISLDDFSE